MMIFCFRRWRRSVFWLSISLAAFAVAYGQGAKAPQMRAQITVADHAKERDAWFFRGRIVAGKQSAELRRHAYIAKMEMRKRRAALATAASGTAVSSSSSSSLSLSSLTWTPLGPVPLASDASGIGLQDYHQVSGRATAVAIDSADATGNTVYIGGAQGGVWKSTNGTNATAANVNWTAVADDQPTLSVGSIAIQPGNSDPTKSVILAGTGEANDSSDSYYGLGILRSADAGKSWTLISSANGGALSFSGLGGMRMAFGTNAGVANTVVSAMGPSNEGMVDGAVNGSTSPGLYTSADAGQSWNYDALLDPGSQATDPTSATSVAYNSGAGSFLAAVRYHGFYSSPDGVNWTRLANQPGGAVLSTTACPPISTSNNFACPMYRAEITTVPGRNEMYVWVISLDTKGNALDGGIWQSLDGGNAWTPINDGGIGNCGDSMGCGVEQGYYNLELMAMPNGSATDLYAGAINIYKCSINTVNPACDTSGFLNLTHALGCDPIAAPAHVHPAQHALGFALPTVGSDAGGALIYFANDGGVYRALSGFTGLNGGSCSSANQFDDLNQNLGSMTQLISFSQHPTDANTLLAGAQGNGSPATNTAITSLSWGTVNGGDGGFNAIDPNFTSDFFVSNADVPPGGLNILECSSGTGCFAQDFSEVVGSNDLDGDDGAFYFPFMLDPQSSPAMIVGTCRVWRGPRLGGTYTALSPNFDTLGTGACLGSEVNLVRALAAGGPTDGNGSEVIYATTDGPGPLNQSGTVGGNVWVTTNATAGASAFAEVTQNINPNQFPVSAVAIDPSDATGNTAYVTIMGFTGATGHVWQTTNGGGTWTDFTGSGSTSLPDAPANAVVVDASTSTVFVGTDVGVFASGTAAPSWTEVGPSASSQQFGFLPNVAVTGLAIFNSGGQKLLRASTYGRGMWQADLNATPDFQIAITNSPQTIFPTQNATFQGTDEFLNGYASSITLTCVSGATAPPANCAPTPPVLNPGMGTFSVIASDVVGDYDFNLQGVGSDTNNITQQVPLTLHVVTFNITATTPPTIADPRGTTSLPVSFQITAGGSFNQNVVVSCSVAGVTGAICNFTPGTSVNPTSTTPVNMTASVFVPAGTAPAIYTATIQATTSGAPAPVSTTFLVYVSTNSDFILSEPSAFPLVNAGSTGENGLVDIASQDGFADTIALSCSLASGAGSCAVSPASVDTFPASVSVTLNAPTVAAGSYQMSLLGTSQGASGTKTHTLAIPFNVGDYQITGPQALSVAPGAQATANMQIAASTFYSGTINATCDASALSAAICTLSPVSPITVSTGATVPLIATIDVPNNAAPGIYNINIDTQDAIGTPSHNLTPPIALTVIQDFSLTNATPPQTITAGQTTGAYQLTVAPNPPGGSFPGAVTLSCSPLSLPPGAQCLFNPSTPVTPGSTAVNVVLTISTVASTSRMRMPGQVRGYLYAFCLMLPGILFGWGATERHRSYSRRVLGFAILFWLAIFLTSCSGATGINATNGTTGQQSTGAGTYAITVTGTSGTIVHSVVPPVGLVVE